MATVDSAENKNRLTLLKALSASEAIRLICIKKDHCRYSVSNAIFLQLYTEEAAYPELDTALPWNKGKTGK